MPLPIRTVVLRRGDRSGLERLIRSRTSAQPAVERPRIVLASADGADGSAICARLGVSRPTVTCSLNRYEADVFAGLLADRPRSGRPKRITRAAEAAIIERTLHTTPAMEQRVPSDLAMHVILDNSAKHKHPTVKGWLERHPRVHFHFTPTSASWLNLVQRFFREITGRQIRRLAVTSVDQLIAAITQYIDRRNKDPTPFVWTATVRQILKKVNKANETLATLR